MTRDIYHRVLELERQKLLDETTRLKSIAEHAAGANRLHCVQQLRAIEHRNREIDERLRSLEVAGDGVWEGIKINIRWIADGLARAIEHWNEQVSARQTQGRASHHP